MFDLRPLRGGDGFEQRWEVNFSELAALPGCGMGSADEVDERVRRGRLIDVRGRIQRIAAHQQTALG